MTFVIIDEWVVTVASVGDSRCILEAVWCRLLISDGDGDGMMLGC